MTKPDDDENWEHGCLGTICGVIVVIVLGLSFIYAMSAMDSKPIPVIQEAD